MINNPYSSLLKAYFHLCCQFGTIPANEIAFTSPQSWITGSQETPPPEATWKLHIIADWNTAARLHLNKYNGCKILLVTLLKQIVTSTTLLTIPFVILGTLRQRLVSRKLRHSAQTKWKLPSALTDLHRVQWPPFPFIPNRDSHSKLLTESPGSTRMVGAISKRAK